MPWLPRNFFHSSFAHLIPAFLLARWQAEGRDDSVDIMENALIFDPKTGRYKLKKEIFDRLLDDAARSVLLDRKN